MRLVLKAAAAILVLRAVVGTLRGLADDDVEIRKVVRVAGHEVTIPTDTPPNVFAVTRALLKQTAYRPWYQHCILGQAERLLSPKEAEALNDLPVSERNRKSVELMQDAIPNCEQPGRQLVDPDASVEQIALIRSQTAESLRLLLKRDRAVPPARRDCAVAQVGKMSDSQVIRLSNSPEDTQEAIWVRLFEPCSQ